MQMKTVLLVMTLMVLLLFGCRKKCDENFVGLSVTVRLQGKHYCIPIPQGVLVSEMNETLEGDTGVIRLVLEKIDQNIDLKITKNY